MNPFTAQILVFRNAEPSKIIILYDDNESRAVPCGNLFYEKGVDNVFIISGGEQCGWEPIQL